MSQQLPKLVRLVPPPAEPARPDWDEVERDLRLRLPTDYKGLVDRYGDREFGGFLRLLDPRVLALTAREILDDEAPLREQEDPAQYPYPFHPEPGGLLGWATTHNGDWLCWLTAGEPDAWPVVVWQRRPMWYHRHEAGAVGFLYGWLTGRVTSLVPPRGPRLTP
ncbi:SMI1/KNR4 family protein [Actinomycetes bacterium KLBMP 9797]